MKRLVLFTTFLTILSACGRSDETDWDQIVENCGPGMQCPIYIKDGNWYYRDTDGSYVLMKH